MGLLEHANISITICIDEKDIRKGLDILKVITNGFTYS